MSTEINQRTNTEWTSYLATGIAEGFEEAESELQTVEAWAYLIKTGLCWSLQGWFGRAATSIIDGGTIDRDGTINWDMVDNLLEA
jgi:hypothetical protein